MKPNTPRYAWYVVMLAALTNALVNAAPSLCMPVLFDEISGDMGLTLEQLGVLWGISAMPGVVTMLMGGIIGDRFGPKRLLMAMCVLAGLVGLSRGLSNSFLTLGITIVMFGFMSSMVPLNSLKVCGMWVSRQQLGLASGIVSMGMALGFTAGSMISATVLSPWLGGWRHVLVFYGVLSALLSIPWYFVRPAPDPDGQRAVIAASWSLRQTMGYVARFKNLWFMGWAILGIGGCVQGMLGYLPLYLRDQGWEAATADSAAATFHIASMICVVPIALWSDRLGSRRRVLLVAALMIASGTGLLSITGGMLVWGAVVLAGMVRDGFMAVFLAMVIETRGIGIAYSGTATGFVMIFSGLGSLVAPPLGNSLARFDPGMPFICWALMAVIGVVGLLAANDQAADRAVTETALVEELHPSA